jgi:TonB family protein
MTSRFVSLIIPLTPAVPSAGTGGSHAISAQEARSSFCGRVVAVSCTGPSSAVTLLVAASSGHSNWRVVIPSEYRPLFGSRIEDRYDQQVVCAAPAADATTGSELVLAQDPGQLVVKGPMQASIALPDDVARTCDSEVDLPMPVREVHPQFTADAMRAKVHGSVVLQGIVDRNGAVRDVRVVQSLEPGLDAAARDAFAQWEFRPATRRGEPVAMAVSVQMAFTMR